MTDRHPTDNEHRLANALPRDQPAPPPWDDPEVEADE